MNYLSRATSKTPALIIYLLDVSRSMNSTVAGSGKTRLRVVEDALEVAFSMMTKRSVIGGSGRIRPRYRVAMFAYSHEVFPILPESLPITEVANLGIPVLEPEDLTYSAKAFEAAEQLLIKEIPKLPEGSPAPLVCHVTDGEYNGGDPEPVVNRIKNMRVQDGNVLVENIFISSKIMSGSINNVLEWGGIGKSEELKTAYAKKLFSLSSTIPEIYVSVMNEFGYQIKQGSKMMLPGTLPGLIELGFVMSTSTRTI